MKLYETTLKERAIVAFRVKANSKEEAEQVFHEFIDCDPGYIADELDLNGAKDWSWTSFDEVNPAKWDEKATITKNTDGTFEAYYEGGDRDE